MRRGRNQTLNRTKIPAPKIASERADVPPIVDTARHVEVENAGFDREKAVDGAAQEIVDPRRAPLRGRKEREEHDASPRPTVDGACHLEGERPELGWTEQREIAGDAAAASTIAGEEERGQSVQERGEDDRTRSM